MNWEPSRSDHSIDKVTITAAFRNQIDVDNFDELVVALRKSANQIGFVHRMEVPDALELQPNSEGVVQLPPMPSVPPRRVLFQRWTKDSTVTDEVSIGSHSLAFATIRYSRWNDFFVHFQSLINGFDSAGCNFPDLKSLKLEYVDSFTSKSVTADVFEVIGRNSEFLADVIRQKDQSFHLHAGWHDLLDGSHRRLTNVNIDVVDFSEFNVEIKKKVTILTLCQTNSLDINSPVSIEMLSQQHDYLKLTYSNIITPEAAKRIALKLD